MRNNDLTLLKYAQDGDSQAITELFEKYNKKAFNVAYRTIGRADLAEDITMEAFLKVIQMKSEIKGEFAPYFYRIVVNNAINYIRKNKKENISYDDFQYDIVASDDPYKETAEKEIIVKIKNALKLLPKNQRTAFILIKYEGFSYNEVSEIMKLSVKAIESLISRAKKNLIKYLDIKVD